MTSRHRKIAYTWTSGDASHSLELVHVPGTGGSPYSFGENERRVPVEVAEFFIGVVPTTQAFWTHVMGMGSNPAVGRGDRRPVENVSWDDVVGEGGFIERLNASPVREALLVQLPVRANMSFRLPSETEWEYAARGGPHWGNGFALSGGNDIDAVAWYDRRGGDCTHEVGQKQPNQLGLYDMSGNVWEWCQDTYTDDVDNIPLDGSPFTGSGSERVLRGGCFHNWAIHCAVTKRYEIAHDYRDGCIGFRLVLADR